MLQRSEAQEMMDQINTQEEMDEVLAEFGKINARFLNHWLIRGFLKKFLRQNQPTSILDLGTGGADIPIYLSFWARERGCDLRICGIDTNPFAADYARRQTQDFGNIEIKNEQVSDLAERYDIIIISQTIHHIPPHEIENFLRSVLAKAGRVVIISDFIRSRLAFYAGKDSPATGYQKSNSPPRRANFGVAQLYEPGAERFFQQTRSQQLSDL